MLFVKFNALKGRSNFVYFKRTEQDANGDIISNADIAIPLHKFLEAEPDFKLLSDGCISVYWEEPRHVLEKKYIDGSKTLIPDDEMEIIRNLLEKALDEHIYDDLLKPPTVEEQVDNFIKDFFEESEEVTTEEQERLLEEFLAELDNDGN